MDCPKCKTANADASQFCKRCHTTLLYKCPSCAATQRHGGACDKCGIDFAKYAAMLVGQEQARATHEHEKVQDHVAAWKQAFLLPITGGYSLLKFFLGRDS